MRRCLIPLIAGLVSTVLATVVFAPPAAATSCASPETGDELAAVIVATVSTRESIGSRDEYGEQAEFFHHEIEDVEYLHGSVPEGLIVEMPEQNGINLGDTLTVGERYGFAFYQFKGNVGSVGTCTASPPQQMAGLANLVPPEGGAEFFAVSASELYESPDSDGSSLIGLFAPLIVGVLGVAVMLVAFFGGRRRSNR